MSREQLMEIRLAAQLDRDKSRDWSTFVSSAGGANSNSSTHTAAATNNKAAATDKPKDKRDELQVERASPRRSPRKPESRAGVSVTRA